LLRLHEHTGSERAEAETFIGSKFANYFGARIDAFMPRLFSLKFFPQKAEFPQ
jgi:hypothetical protein